MANLLQQVSLPRLGANWISNPSVVTRYWNTAMMTIESFINGINQAFNVASGAQTAADAAASAADGAQTAADNAQSSADTAQTTANTVGAALAAKLDKPTADGYYVHQVNPSNWTAPAGTQNRNNFSTYTPITAGVTYNSADVQNVANSLQLLSTYVAALIADLQTNKVI